MLSFLIAVSFLISFSSLPFRPPCLVCRSALPLSSRLVSETCSACSAPCASSHLTPSPIFVYIYISSGPIARFFICFNVHSVSHTTCSTVDPSTFLPISDYTNPHTPDVECRKAVVMVRIHPLWLLVRSSDNYAYSESTFEILPQPQPLAVKDCASS